MYSCCVLYRNSLLLRSGVNICDTTEKFSILTGNPWLILETKRAERNASEHHLNHGHMGRWGKTPPMVLFQSIVLNTMVSWTLVIKRKFTFWHGQGIYVMIYDRTKFECSKWRATFTATTYAEAPMWSTVNGGLPLLVLPFFRVVYVDTDGARGENWHNIRHDTLFTHLFTHNRVIRWWRNVFLTVQNEQKQQRYFTDFFILSAMVILEFLCLQTLKRELLLSGSVTIKYFCAFVMDIFTTI